MGTIAALVCLFVAYMGMTGEATGLGVITIPIIAGMFAVFCFKGSMRIHVLFDLMGKKQKYRSWPDSFDETLAAIGPLLDWARKKGIAVDMRFKLPAET